MSDVIKLLPAHIANQIAAGEVVQRPSSVVKELIENAIDAGATEINLLAKDGGKTLVQVVDNGSGMSLADAKMSFERHATSKIAKADDLFALQTKGFRGEALASIAAIAHVSMKTKLHDAELGIEIVNEGSKIVSEEEVMCKNGTSIAVKNLFFNVPARRNFLGKNTTEYRKVLDEFLRIALVHPDIKMTFHHDGEEIFNLPVSNIRQRISFLFGKSFDQRLVPVNEETDIVKISGYVTKPEFAKSKSDQSFLFVNNRFFKDRYLNHAILNAYEGLVPSGKYPPYFLYFEVPSQSIDVNVHPTKTEIKFEENQAIYAFLRSAVKQALGQFNVAPTLDFEQETSLNVPSLKKGETVKMPEIKVNPDFNPFKSTAPPKSSGTGVSGNRGSNGFSKIQPQRDQWEEISAIKEDAQEKILSFGEVEDDSQHNEVTVSSSMNEESPFEAKRPVQINEKYIMCTVKNGFILIDQYRAHLRIIYDDLMSADSSNDVQKLLFEEKVILEKKDQTIWKDIEDSILELGFEVKLENEELVVSGIPAIAKDANPGDLLSGILEAYSLSEQDEELEIKSKLALSLASGAATKGGNALNTEEMQYIVDALFASTSPQYSPHGKKIIETFTVEEILKRFN